jgi:hypothetical protein
MYYIASTSREDTLTFSSDVEDNDRQSTYSDVLNEVDRQIRDEQRVEEDEEV